MMKITSAKIANISWQCAALVKQAVFSTVPVAVNGRREAAAQTSSVTLSEEGGAGILKDMVDQLPAVSDTLIMGS